MVASWSPAISVLCAVCDVERGRAFLNKEGGGRRAEGGGRREEGLFTRIRKPSSPLGVFVTLEGSRIQAPLTIHRASHSTQKQDVSPSSRLMQVDVNTDRTRGWCTSEERQIN